MRVKGKGSLLRHDLEDWLERSGTRIVNFAVLLSLASVLACLVLQKQRQAVHKLVATDIKDFQLVQIEHSQLSRARCPSLVPGTACFQLSQEFAIFTSNPCKASLVPEIGSCSLEHWFRLSHRLLCSVAEVI